MELEPQQITVNDQIPQDQIPNNLTPEIQLEINPEVENTAHKPLEILRNTEVILRRSTVAAIMPIVPTSLSAKIEAASHQADHTLEQLAKIDIEEISDWELRSARIAIGLTFVGFGALTVVILVLYLKTLHSELSLSEQIAKYWYPYIGFVNLGVTGMFVLGREAMRTPKRKSKPKRRDYSYLKDKWE